MRPHDTHPPPGGRCYEDFAIGDRFDTASRVITGEDVIGFAGLTGDHTALHTDEASARAGPFGRRIAHGAFVFSLSLGLTTQTDLLLGIVALSRVDGLRFVRPVFIGDTVRVVKRVIATEPHRALAGVVAFDTRVLNQHDQIVAAYVDRVLLSRRATASDRSSVADTSDTSDTSDISGTPAASMTAAIVARG